MKWLFGILGVAGAGFLGYVVEPSLRESLTGIDASASQTPVAEAPAEEPVPEPEPEPAPEPEPVEVAVSDPADPMEPAEPVTPDPADEPAADEPVVDMPEEPAPEPEMADAGEPAEPEEEKEAEPAEPAAADVVSVMKASIQNAEIKEFGFDQVQTWEAAEDEEFEGSTHQVGLLSYTAETMFGKKTMQAKAYIKGGKVQRWVWPTSGMEIE